MNMRYLIIFFIIYLFSQCAYKTHVFLANIDQNRQRIYFKVPSKYIDKRAFYDESFKSVGILYGDSSIIYISEKNSKFLPNFYNVNLSQSKGKYLIEDSIAVVYSGILNDKAWKEIIYKNVIRIGYSDVPLNKISTYEKALIKTLPNTKKTKN